MQDQRMKVNIDLKKTTSVTCEECGCSTFQEALMLRKVSKFLTGDMQDGVIPIATFVCAKCGHVNKDFYPKELTNEQE
jgi:predicted nucleic-acid-binding Zn-ribbon protein